MIEENRSCPASAVVPVYHTDPGLLRACVKSLREQTEEGLELLLVFDGTLEEYRELLAEPLFSAPGVRAIGIPEGGVSAARNAGIRAARGEWLTFVDSDDVLPPTALEELLSAAGGADLVIGDYETVSGGKASRHNYKKKGFRAGTEVRQELLEDVLNPQSGMGFCWGKLYRRELILRTGLAFYEGMEVAEDTQFVLRYVMEARSVCYIPRTVYAYQIHPASVVRAFRPDYEARYERSMGILQRTLWETGWEERLHMAYETCVLYHVLLLAVNFSFHPEQKKSRSEKISGFKELIQKPVYAQAIAQGDAARFQLTRRISVWLLRRRLYGALYVVAWLRHRQRGRG